MSARSRAAAALVAGFLSAVAFVFGVIVGIALAAFGGR